MATESKMAIKLNFHLIFTKIDIFQFCESEKYLKNLNGQKIQYGKNLKKFIQQSLYENFSFFQIL
jgi:hypothetical protein